MTVSKELEVIRGLYESLNRPVEIKQIDLGLTSLLVIKGGLVRPVHTSESALALALIVSEPTVTASVNRLQGVKWVQKRSGKSRRLGNSYVVILENLPVAEELKRTLVTPMARTIAGNYMKAMPTNAKGRPRRYTKAERQRIAFALQSFLDKYVAGDGKLLCDVINFAMSHPKYAARARKGPHMLRRPFKKLLEELKAGTKPAEPAKPSDAEFITTKLRESFTNLKVEPAGDWQTVWPVEFQKLLNAGHGVGLIRSVARFALGVDAHRAEIVKRGPAYLVERFALLAQQAETFGKQAA